MMLNMTRWTRLARPSAAVRASNALLNGARRPASATVRFLSTEVDDVQSKSSVLPTHIKFRMPDLDFEHVLGGDGGVTLTKWQIQEGQEIKDGTHMCEIDTPDLVFVLDSGDEGYLARLLVPEGAKDVPPGQPLAIIVPTKEDIEPFIDALKQNPTAIEGYVEPVVIEATPAIETAASASTSDSVDNSDGAVVLRHLHKLHKEGHFADEKIFKTLKSLARKNDAQLLVTYKGSFPSSGARDDATFDVEFFVETAVELAEEALASDSSSTQ
ncbi:hypothetical protein Poli38472_000450 [Pythium oligandrum]|uniref:Lipoyl-binding domain-containing protein n=1 Tax=Pythium oligandrum TaxID=41045 RepID=A0A8K1CCC8_PYTOL|nr:hypothetical protein Poli38472_000450 [Pythium oligandrum]|eukprot:TMW60408.1 hypothetical protein Poli38472_000450 [Pythium oligandrum]